MEREEPSTAARRQKIQRVWYPKCLDYLGKSLCGKSSTDPGLESPG